MPNDGIGDGHHLRPNELDERLRIVRAVHDVAVLAQKEGLVVVTPVGEALRRELTRQDRALAPPVVLDRLWSCHFCVLSRVVASPAGDAPSPRGHVAGCSRRRERTESESLREILTRERPRSDLLLSHRDEARHRGPDDLPIDATVGEEVHEGLPVGGHDLFPEAIGVLSRTNPSERSAIRDSTSKSGSCRSGAFSGATGHFVSKSLPRRAPAAPRNRALTCTLH